MRKLCLVVLLGLGGCAYNLTLYPRGGGEVAKGSGSSADQTMEVVLRGETYKGSYVRATSTGIGFANSYGARPTFGTATMVGASNQFSALLTNGSAALRCEFMATTQGGNGVCVDSTNAVYDLQIELAQ